MASRWNKNDLDTLKMLYSNTNNKELSKILNRSETSILCIANKIGLKKTKEHRGKHLSEINKNKGRDLSYENLVEIAKKYKSKSEFQLKDASAYNTCLRNNWLDDLCNHMPKSSFSIPQMMLFELVKNFISNNTEYNNRSIIKPYELDIYVNEYKIAFEYNGKYWHKNDKIDKHLLCSNNNIKLFTFVENSRNYENDIKTQFINFLNIINNIVKTQICETDIINFNLNFVYDKIVNLKDIKEICDKYTDYKTFIKEEKSIANKLKSLKKIKEYTSHMKKQRIYWTLDLIMSEVNKYTTLSDFYTKSYKCYSFIKSHKEYDYLLKPLTKLKL